MIDRMGFVFRCLLVLGLFFYSWRLVSLNGVASAHSGRTDSSGGHNCRTGSCAGTYHYHNGGPAKTTIAPTIAPTKASVIVSTTAPTSIPTVAPTKAPAAISIRSTPTVDPTNEPEVLGSSDVEDDGGSGDAILALVILGGMGWVGMKGARVGVKGVKKMVKKVGDEVKKN